MTAAIDQLHEWAQVTSLKGTISQNPYFGFDLAVSRGADGKIVNGISVTGADPADRLDVVSIAKIRDGQTVASATFMGHSAFDLGAETIMAYRKH